MLSNRLVAVPVSIAIGSIENQVASVIDKEQSNHSLAVSNCMPKGMSYWKETLYLF